MEYYNNTLCVEVDFLVENKILSKPNYDKLIRGGVLNRVRRGCRNTSALITYDSLPTRFQSKVCDIIPDPHKAAKINMVESRICESKEAGKFFDEYRLPDGRFLTKETRREYYANAIVLNAVKAFIVEKRNKRASLNKRMVRSWDQLAEYVQDIDRQKYPHTLPANPRRLEGRYLQYQKDGHISLIHKNFLNVNAAKVDDEVKKSVIVELLADARNLDNEQVRSMYNMVAERMNWKKITRAAVAVWREKYETEIYAGRRGTNAFSNKKAMQVKRTAPTYPLYYWTLDGWDAELMYQKTENGRTTYHNRPTVVIVLDACLKYPIGYAVGTHETPELIKSALRNAMKHTQQLFGKMYRTQQIQSDRYSIKKMTPVYNGISEYFTPARVGNAKSKIIEPYFNRINRKYCQLMPNWSGFGITSNREKQPNMEVLQKYKSNFPDFEGVCRQIDMIIEREREDNIERYMELWDNMPVEHKIEMPYEGYLLGFGETTGKRNLLQGSGLKITIGGLKHDYDCFDISIREHFSTRWEVRYDPDDISRVLAVNEDESLRYMMEEKYVQPMALIEREEGDYEQLERIRDYNKQLEDKVIDFRAKTGTCVRELMEEHKELDTLKKFLITDSSGQHKDRRNDSRCKELASQDVTEDSGEIDIYSMY